MLETIWFLLWGLLWAIYFMLDGFDLGLGTLRPFIARNDTESRIIYNVMGPFWDGNEVWLITAGGVTFAAFPTTYAVMFSTLYAPLLLILFGLIIRAVSFEFRGQLDSPGWRKIWDSCLFVGSFVPALLFGVAFANIFQGIPFDDKGVFHGTLFTLLNPYGILGGVLFVLLFLSHGSLWLAVKAEGPLYDRAAALSSKLWAAAPGRGGGLPCAYLVCDTSIQELPQSAFSFCHSTGHGCSSADHEIIYCQESVVECLVCVLSDHSGRYAVRSCGALSKPVPIEPEPGFQPHRVQFVIQSFDAEDYAGRGPDICADRNSISGVGLLPLQRQGYARIP